MYAWDSFIFDSTDISQMNADFENESSHFGFPWQFEGRSTQVLFYSLGTPQGGRLGFH